MRRVVITGIGIIAPNGFNVLSFWENCNLGRSFVMSDQEMLDLKFKSNVLSRIKGFHLEQHVNVNDYPELMELDPFVQYGVAASEQAINDTALQSSSLNLEQIGIVFSSAIGGTPSIANIFKELTNAGRHDVKYKKIGTRFYNSGMFNYPAMLVAKKYGFSNLCTSVTTGCTAGLDSLGICFDYIRSGDADIMLAGASEAPLTPLTYATLDVINSLATFDGPAEAASRPFDAKRSGFVISEGAVVLVLEELEHALHRNATIYSEVASFGSVSNAYHMTNLPEDGLPMVAAVKKALINAKMTPEKIEYINAHGSSTPQNDVFETSAYKKVFGEFAKQIPISSVKSMVGHSLSSASLMGTVSVIGAIVNSIIHPTINYEYPDDKCDLNYVPNKALHKNINVGMVTASGFGGIHSAAILKKYSRGAY